MATHTFVNANGTQGVDLVEEFTDYGDHKFADVRLADDTVITVFAVFVIDNNDLHTKVCDQCYMRRSCLDMDQYGFVCLPCYREEVLLCETED